MSTAVTAEISDPPPLHCYRHPDRETWVRCGRCDQPICLKCAMQGPVGLRCKTCGKPSRDPLTAMTPQQMLVGALVALGAGTLGGFVGQQFGFFLAIIAGPIAGGLIAEAVMRVTGYKRGAKMWAIVGGGIVLGAILGATFFYLSTVAATPPEYASEFAPMMVTSMLTGGVIYVIAALIGAATRIR